MAQIPIFPISILFFCFITFFQASSASSKPTGLSMKLIRRDLLFPGNLTTFQRIRRLVQLSVRAQNFVSFSSLNQSEGNVLVHLPLRRVPKDLAYVVEFKIGNKPQTVKLLMDTGSSLIWTQCAPCIKCYQQKTSLYKPRISMTYRKLPCSHPLCQGGNSPFRCHNNECVNDIRYGDLSQPTTPRTKGVASFETFHIPVDSSHTRVINDMIFGCSNDNSDTSFENSQISGILGLSRGPDGLTSQLAKRGIIQNRFSYCLVPFHDELKRPSILRFGDDIPRPMNHYYVELLDISVGLQKMGFESIRGSLIDSGALVSRIDENTVRRNAYQEVIEAFKAYYDKKNIRRKVGQVAEKFEVCYYNKAGFRDFATMTLHFKGSDYLIDGKYMHYFSDEKKGEGYFCVAVSKSSKTTLGAWQQQNMRTIYDMNGSRLQWATETCANDHSP
ncbi:aspartic proteinase nepenthesin-2-like [Gossypium australe]|uniref:Aspartic proteinase nepenthesin-2-like n=1 Tax=Gossypium australe TaxID=47621 RepID=A0A5B6VGB2_9ROSI|nr:aspartic proteinase nepenthesin-2-like [Gossypium australe]